MMIAVRIVAILLVLSSLNSSNAATHYDDVLTTDSRIKTYVYSPNNIYLLVLHYGFQSSIEFAQNEHIEFFTVGDSYAWKITPVGNNRLFIKPMKRDMRTNMTIITNKRTYQFDIVARELKNEEDKDLVYVVRFQYPKKSR